MTYSRFLTSLILIFILQLAAEQGSAQNGLTTVEKQPVYSLELNQDDRDRMDELIVELRQLNTWLKNLAPSSKQKPRRPRRKR